MTIPTYAWFDQIPEHWKTRNQLADLGLRPGGPVVARVVWRRGRRWANLYDQRLAVPKRQPTAAQRAALAAAHQARCTCPGCQTVFPFVLPRRFDCPECHQRMLDRDRATAIRWARQVLAEPAVIIDLETTGLDGYIVQAAVLRMDGTVVLSTLVNPCEEIEPDAQAVHGISAAMVADAPTFDDLEATLRGSLVGRTVLAYNAAFEQRIVGNEVRRQYRQRVGPAPPGYCRQYQDEQAVVAGWMRTIRWLDVMETYAAFCGDWSDAHGDYRWPRLGGDHSALGDCQATLRVLRTMAAAAVA
jgi:hypothetical protein